jgi:hypothetical protein
MLPFYLTAVLPGAARFKKFYLKIFSFFFAQNSVSCGLTINAYFKIYKGKERKMYNITPQFIKLLVEKTIDAPAHEKLEFLNKYQDKKILNKCKNRSKKLYAPETFETGDNDKLWDEK